MGEVVDMPVKKKPVFDEQFIIENPELVRRTCQRLVSQVREMESEVEIKNKMIQKLRLQLALARQDAREKQNARSKTTGYPRNVQK
jgi:hypothetical protein